MSLRSLLLGYAGAAVMACGLALPASAGNELTSVQMDRVTAGTATLDSLSELGAVAPHDARLRADPFARAARGQATPDLATHPRNVVIERTQVSGPSVRAESVARSVSRSSSRSTGGVSAVRQDVRVTSVTRTSTEASRAAEARISASISQATAAQAVNARALRNTILSEVRSTIRASTHQR